MRRKDREVTSIDEIRQILDKTKVLHLGLYDGEYPYIVPMHYGYVYQDDTLIFYMHGAKEGHKIDLINRNPKVCVELECDTELDPGGEIPCNYGAYFASVIGKGTAEVVTDEQEKICGLQQLMRNQTGREFAVDGTMAASVTVIKVTVAEFTAKARKKG
jgi:uncharacterized protein